MKTKILAIILAVIICLSVFSVFVACEKDTSKVDEPPTNTEQPNNSDQPNNDNKPQEEVLPTKSEIVTARQNAINESVHNYEYTLSLRGDFSIMGLGAGLSGKYDGFYHYDKDTDDLRFKRTTSGALLFDSTEYMFTSGDSRIKMKMDGNEIKKVSIETPENQDITMINLPVVAIVDALKESNISNIKALNNSKYSYSCAIQLDTSNIVSKTLNKVFEKLGTGVSFDGITLVADASSLSFNLKNSKLTDFALSFQMLVIVENKGVLVTVEYEQKATTKNIVIPNISNQFLFNSKDIEREINTINSTFATLKNDSTYSLDFSASNKFDPGWNKLSINDSYTARIFKNTVDDVAWFNHSYCFKSHSENDGKETYKYTLGNINGKDSDNQGTWLISRKSSNTQTKVDNVTADTQFDFLTAVFKLNASEIDCIKKVTENGETRYCIYIGNKGAKTVQEKILGIIITNEYDDVISVNNYFNDNNIIKDAEIEIVVKDGKITKATCDTKLRYTPTGGDYDEYNITLTNSVSLLVNENLKKAQEYVAPTKVKGTLGIEKNLNDSEYYIL